MHRQVRQNLPLMAETLNAIRRIETTARQDLNSYRLPVLVVFADGLVHHSHAAGSDSFEQTVRTKRPFAVIGCGLNGAASGERLHRGPLPIGIGIGIGGQHTLEAQPLYRIFAALDFEKAAALFHRQIQRPVEKFPRRTRKRFILRLHFAAMPFQISTRAPFRAERDFHGLRAFPGVQTTEKIVIPQRGQIAASDS